MSKVKETNHGPEQKNPRIKKGKKQNHQSGLGRKEEPKLPEKDQEKTEDKTKKNDTKKSQEEEKETAGRT